MHAASDMGGAVRDGWPFYRQLVGAAFLGHTRTHVWAAAAIGSGTVYEGPLADGAGRRRVVRGHGPLPLVGARPRQRRGCPLARHARVGPYRSACRRVVRVPGEPAPDTCTCWPRSTRDSYDPFQGDMGPGAADHPIAWCQVYEGGRSVYTGMGHPAAAWSDSRFLRHVLGGIRMAAGEDRFDVHGSCRELATA